MTAASEEWRQISGYEGRYEVSSLGRVRSNASGSWRILRPELDKSGYEKLCLSLDGKRKRCFVHRLVAYTFIGGDGETVNHKDLDKRNNTPANLEWMSRVENLDHALDSGVHTKPRKPVLGVGPSGEGLYLRKINLAPRFGFIPVCITQVVIGKHKTHKGWTWSYA